MRESTRHLPNKFHELIEFIIVNGNRKEKKSRNLREIPNLVIDLIKNYYQASNYCLRHIPLFNG